jgi:hypothetical protein
MRELQKIKVAFDARIAAATSESEIDAAVVDRLRPRAAALVEEHWPQIQRIAAALAAGAVLDQDGVDALMAARGTSPWRSVTLPASS